MALTPEQRAAKVASLVKARAARAAKRAAEEQSPMTDETTTTADAAAAQAKAAAREAAQAEAKAGSSQVEMTQGMKVARNIEATKADRVARLKAARASRSDPQPVQMVKARVLKKGDGKISTGEHEPGLGDLTYEHKEEISLPIDTAQELEERGFVEIVD